MQSRLVLVTLAAAVALAPAVRAAEPKKLTVTVVPYAPLFGTLPQTTGDKVAGLVAEELAANDGFEIVPVSEGRAPKAAAVAKSSEEELEASKAGVAEALALFEKGAKLAKIRTKVKPAADTIEKGIKQFLANFEGAADFRPLSDAYVQLALLKFKLGRDEQAKDLLADLVRLDSKRVLDSERDDLAASFVKRHELAREKLLSGGRGLLQIGSTPAGARVTLDGVDVGETPLLAKEVLPGEHYVVVTKPGTGAAWKKLVVKADETTTFEPGLAGEPSGPLASLARNLAENKLTDASFAVVKKVGEASKADFVLFGAVHSGGERIDAHTFMTRTKDGTTIELAALAFDLEMLGAGIEIYKLAEDFTEKSKDWIGTEPMTPMAVIGTVSAPSADVTVSELSITPERTAKQAVVEEVKRPTRVIVPGGRKEEPAVVVEENAAAVVATPEEEPRRPLFRERRKIGEKTEEKAPAKKDEGGLDLGGTQAGTGDVGAIIAGGEPEKPLDLNAPEKKTGSSSAALTPEELEKLERAGATPAGRGPDGGTIALWSGVGVLGAGLIAGGLLLFMAPPPPTSATARITWNP